APGDSLRGLAAAGAQASPATPVAGAAGGTSAAAGLRRALRCPDTGRPRRRPGQRSHPDGAAGLNTLGRLSPRAAPRATKILRLRGADAEPRRRGDAPAREDRQTSLFSGVMIMRANPARLLLALCLVSGAPAAYRAGEPQDEASKKLVGAL